MSKPNPRPTVRLGELADAVDEYCRRTGKSFSDVTRAMWAKRVGCKTPKVTNGRPPAGEKRC